MGWYATIITAPNSLIPRANIITKPETMLRQANGRDMEKNVRVGDAPNESDAFSSLSGTASKPIRAELIRKGTLTKAMANPMAIGLPTRLRPIESAIRPSTESRLIKPSIAIPAAECGITTGRSTIPVISFLKGNLFLAKMYAKGIATNANKIEVNSETHTVNPIDDCTSVSIAVANNTLTDVANSIPSSGATMKSSSKPLRKLKSVLIPNRLFGILKNI